MHNQQISTKAIIYNKLITPSVVVILLMAVFSALTFKYWVIWPNNPFQMDVDQYYSYLVAQFIHHDLSFQFEHQYWLVPTPTGQLIPKVTMGMSFLYLPFFIIANNIAYAFDFDGLGYSAPYAWCIHIGSIIYVLIGFWYTRKTLLLFFNEWVTALTCFLILFGTNLFYYTYKESEMTHGYLFFLFSVFIYHVIKWHHTNKNKHLYYFSFTAGFIALIRPTEALVLLVPLLYQVSNVKTLVAKFKLMASLKWKLLLAILLFLLPLVPQLIYWKIHTGQFLFFSYGSQEGFFFNDPKLYSVLLGWRKGWFIYTPLMLFSIIGLVLMFKKWKGLSVPLTIYLLLNIYLVSSWWDWGFGGAYGMRALVQTYAFLALPLAFFINYVFSIHKKWIKAITVSLSISFFVLFTTINIHHTWLLKNTLFHWDSMTKEAYQFTFLRMNYGRIDRVYLETLFKNPNYEEMRKGIRDEK